MKYIRIRCLRVAFSGDIEEGLCRRYRVLPVLNEIEVLEKAMAAPRCAIRNTCRFNTSMEAVRRCRYLDSGDGHSTRYNYSIARYGYAESDGDCYRRLARIITNAEGSEIFQSTMPLW